MDTVDTVIIGAGPAGLACAAELARVGIPALILERGSAIASSWRARYDRLRLNTTKWFSALPGQKYPPGTSAFPDRDSVVRYLEGYAGTRGLRIRTGTEVVGLERSGARWRLALAKGERETELGANNVVIATGYFREPFVPDWPGRQRYRGQLVHASQYRNPTPFRDSSVLVVGPGSSGMEIAYDLVEAGVSPVRLAVRTPPNILLRSRIGDALALMLMRLPPRLADAVASRLRRMAVGDLGAYGLPSPAVGVFSRLRQEGATPTIVDKEIIAAIRARRIAVVAGAASLEQDGARLVDDTFVEANVIIAATGYRSGLPKMLARLDDLDLLDARGYPRQSQGEEAAPGLRFIGFRPLPAALGRLGRQARRIARGIAQRSREDPSLGRTADAKGTPA